MAENEKVNLEIKKYLEVFSNFILNNDDFAILYDNDPDGICSVAIVEKYIKSYNKKINLKLPFLDQPKPFSKEFNENFKDQKIKALIILDFNIAGFGYLEEYNKFTTEFNNISIMIIDHHRDDSNYKNATTINSASFNLKIPSSQICTTKIVFELTKNNKEIKKNEWIYAIGLIGDANHLTWMKDIVEVVKNDNKNITDLKHKEIITPIEFEDVYITPYGKSSHQIFFAIAKSKNETPNILQKINSSKNVFEFIDKMKGYNEVKEEVYDYIDNYNYFEKNQKEDIKELQIFEMEIKSNYEICSIVSNILSQKNKNTIFFVYQKRKDGFVYISTRLGNSKINLGKILQKCIEHPDTNAGGHAPAAGARVLKENFKQFLNKFYYEIEKVEI